MYISTLLQWYAYTTSPGFLMYPFNDLLRLFVQLWASGDKHRSRSIIFVLDLNYISWHHNLRCLYKLHRFSTHTGLADYECLLVSCLQWLSLLIILRLRSAMDKFVVWPHFQYSSLTSNDTHLHEHIYFSGKFALCVTWAAILSIIIYSSCHIVKPG